MSEIKTNNISAISNANLQLNVNQTQRVLITPTVVEVTGAVKATSTAIIAGSVRIGSTVAPTVALDVVGAVKATTTITAETFNKTKPYLVSAYKTLTDIIATGTVKCTNELIDTQNIYNPSTGLITSPFTSDSYWRMSWSAQVKYTLDAVINHNFFQPILNGDLIDPITYTESIGATDGQIDHMSGSHIILVPASGTLGLHFTASIGSNPATRDNEIITFELITVV